MIVLTLARKPVAGTVAQNALHHGTGGLNIDGARIGSDRPPTDPRLDGWRKFTDKSLLQTNTGDGDTLKGRWPSNVILQHKPGCLKVGTKKVPGYTIQTWDDGAKVFGGGAGHPFTSRVVAEEIEADVWECEPGCPVAALDAQSGTLTSGTGAFKRASGTGYQAAAYGVESRPAGTPNIEYGDSGGACRFFKQVQVQPYEIEFVRAAGDVPCPVCGREYREHPEHPRLGSTFHTICDGLIVKT